MYGAMKRHEIQVLRRAGVTHVPACMLAKSPLGTLYTEDSDEFVASFAAPIATGWNDQLPGGIQPH